MGFLRSFLGFGEVKIKRTVVGASVGFGLQEVEFIKSSNQRLTLLQELAARYGGTPHAPKLKQVYEKTKSIHSFLVSKKKVHALEMFHLQNTDHFITTFTVILDVHQDHQQATGSTSFHSKAGAKAPFPEPKPWVARVEKAPDLPEMIKPITSQNQLHHGADGRVPVPRLYVPDISIITFEQITFLHENAAGNLVAHQVGSTSSKQEKEIFQQHVSSRLGLEDVSYIGNAHLTIPNSNGVTPTGIVPILYWEGFHYALNLNDCRLFPVRIYRKGM